MKFGHRYFFLLIFACAGILLSRLDSQSVYDTSGVREVLIVTMGRIRQEEKRGSAGQRERYARWQCC